VRNSRPFVNQANYFMAEDTNSNEADKRKAPDDGFNNENEPTPKNRKLNEVDKDSQVETTAGNPAVGVDSYSMESYHGNNIAYDGYSTTDYTTSMYSSSGYPYYYPGVASVSYASPPLTNVSSYAPYATTYTPPYSPPLPSFSTSTVNSVSATSSSLSTTTTATVDPSTNTHSSTTTPVPESGDDASKETSTKKKNKNPYMKKFLRYAAGEIWEDPTLAEWPENDFRIFVGNIANDVSDNLLYTTFASKYSSTVKAKVIRDKRTGRARYGFVSLMDPQEFVRALKEMNGKYIGSHPVALRKSTWKERSLEKQRQKQKEKQKLFKK
jgi:hypothetical protein